ncbi:hypothetical protein V5799_009785 [Amblyomma americanum]|uniref:Uncharacterized protein n=1 Tax=Amblyomma americanum TaxID=6943 RepID=A0AAQ4FAM0_AMBAM
MSVRLPQGPNMEYDHNRVLTWLQDWMSVSTNEEEDLGPPVNHYATISSLGHRSTRSAPWEYVDPDYVVSAPSHWLSNSPFSQDVAPSWEWRKFVCC